jgi:hypothetical protein
MENIKIFFIEKELLTLYVLREYICDDIIIKIIEYSKKDKQQIAHMNIIHRDIFRYSSLLNMNHYNQGQPLSSLLFGNNIDELSQSIPDSNQDIYRMIYLKEKMSKKETGHYSKHMNTWIKFQYHLTNSRAHMGTISTLGAHHIQWPASQNKTYGFNGVKKLSDVLYII